MKNVAVFLFFSAVCFSAVPDRPREPEWSPFFYVVRAPKLESLNGVWIKRITVTIAKSAGCFLSAVPSDWLVSTETKDGTYRFYFFPWPVSPGEPIKKHLSLESLDQVVLIAPSDDPSGMPVSPRISLTVEYVKDGVGFTSIEVGEAKVEFRRITQDGLNRR